ncbi:MAG: hypothetical protein ACW99F_07440 [Candidatus Hodarchaeales archaeon]|jgi:hypothetical protein
MSIVEQFKVKHRFNDWDYRSMGLNINEILDFSVENNRIFGYNEYRDHCFNCNIDYSITRVEDGNRGKQIALLNHDFRFVETTYRVSCRLSSINNLTTCGLKNKNITKDTNINELSNLAYDIFEYGRFAEDLTLQKDLSDLRNKKWSNDLYNSEANRLFLYNKAELIGFMFYDIDKDMNKAELILGGMSNKYGYLARSFWSHVFQSLPNGCLIQTNISSKNLGILNLYSLFGFKFISAKSGYHKKWNFK